MVNGFCGDMDGQLERSDSGGQDTHAHTRTEPEHAPGITELYSLRPFQCHEDPWEAVCAAHVLLDVCVTFVISEHPPRRCALPLSQSNAFKPLPAASMLSKENNNCWT